MFQLMVSEEENCRFYKHKSYSILLQKSDNYVCIAHIYRELGVPTSNKEGTPYTWEIGSIVQGVILNAAIILGKDILSLYYVRGNCELKYSGVYVHPEIALSLMPNAGFIYTKLIHEVCVQNRITKYVMESTSLDFALSFPESGHIFVLSHKNHCLISLTKKSLFAAVQKAKKNNLVDLSFVYAIQSKMPYLALEKIKKALAASNIHDDWYTLTPDTLKVVQSISIDCEKRIS